MTRQPRGLSSGDLEILAQWCEAVAGLARSANASRIQRFIGDAVNGYLPGRSSVIPPAPISEVVDGEPVDWTGVERRVVRPDRVEQEMLALLAAQRDVMRALPAIYSGWKACDPDRRPESCPHCSQPFPRGSVRCDNLVDDGQGGKRRCESRQQDRTCVNPRCAIPVPPGTRGTDGQRCPDCTKVFRDTGRERIPQTALGLGANMLVAADGVFNGDTLDTAPPSVPAPGSGIDVKAVRRATRKRLAAAEAAARWSVGG